VIQNTANGLDMPVWAMATLGMLLATFFAIRLLAYLRFIVERESYLREKKIDAEIQQSTLALAVRKLELEERARNSG